MKIWHQYQHRSKIKKIVTLSGLKRYCAVNKKSIAAFLAEHHGFVFYAINEKIDCYKCKLCYNNLKIRNIDEADKKINFVMCSCSEHSSLSITLNRFFSVFDNEIALQKYEEFCIRKTKKWQPKKSDCGSLEFYTQKYGEIEGTIKYKEKNKKCDTVSRKYFLNQGFLEDDAVKKEKERQSTFSLAKCIIKYGEEEGRKIWQERQDKWQNTLLSKSEEEILQINKSKKNGPYSKVSQKLFKEIDMPGARWFLKNGERGIKLSSGKIVYPDFLYHTKIIEFYGDKWHRNPIIYNENDIDFTFTSRKRTSIVTKEIWNKDAARIASLKELGYDVLIIWEYDFKKDASTTIKKCMDFLCNT